MPRWTKLWEVFHTDINVKIKDDIELHPEESVVRKKMHELYSQHQRYGTVARILNEEGYKKVLRYSN